VTVAPAFEVAACPDCGALDIAPLSGAPAAAKVRAWAWSVGRARSAHADAIRARADEVAPWR
jgi:hypothetical protein